MENRMFREYDYPEYDRDAYESADRNPMRYRDRYENRDFDESSRRRERGRYGQGRNEGFGPRDDRDRWGGRREFREEYADQGWDRDRSQREWRGGEDRGRFDDRFRDEGSESRGGRGDFRGEYDVYEQRRFGRYPEDEYYGSPRNTDFETEQEDYQGGRQHFGGTRRGAAGGYEDRTRRERYGEDIDRHRRGEQRSPERFEEERKRGPQRRWR